jgi:hypothetical protein
MRTSFPLLLLTVIACERAPLDKSTGVSPQHLADAGVNLPTGQGGAGGDATVFPDAGLWAGDDALSAQLGDAAAYWDDPDGGGGGPDATTYLPPPDAQRSPDLAAPSDAEAAPPLTPAVAAACARPSHEIAAPPQGVAAFLQRRWILCSDKGIGHRAQAGIEIRGDGRFSLLGWTADGHLAPMTGVENEGTLDLQYTSQTGQLDFVRDVGLTMIVHPTYQAGPDAMVLNNEGVFTYRYVAADTVALPVSPVPYPIVDPQPPLGSCGDTPGSINAIKTIAQARAAVSRRWLRCSKDDLTTGNSAGLEITADDHYYALERRPDGTLARSPGFAGSIEYLDTSSVNGRPTIQLNFTHGGGTIISQLVISQAPVFLLIDNEGVYFYRYRALD